MTKDFTSKAKDLTSEAKAKATDMTSCSRGATSPRPPWPRGLHFCNHMVISPYAEDGAVHGLELFCLAHSLFGLAQPCIFKQLNFHALASTTHCFLTGLFSCRNSSRPILFHVLYASWISTTFSRNPHDLTNFEVWPETGL